MEGLFISAHEWNHWNSENSDRIYYFYEANKTCPTEFWGHFSSGFVHAWGLDCKEIKNIFHHPYSSVWPEYNTLKALIIFATFYWKILSLKIAREFLHWNKSILFIHGINKIISLLALERKQDVLNLLIFFIFTEFPTQVIQKMQRHYEKRDF